MHQLQYHPPNYITPLILTSPPPTLREYHLDCLESTQHESRKEYLYVLIKNYKDTFGNIKSHTNSQFH